MSKSNILNNEYNICSNVNNVLNRFYGNNWRTRYITHTHGIDFDNLKLSSFTPDNIIDLYLIRILKLFNLNQVK